jgi:acyl transferase domain-containing protein
MQPASEALEAALADFKPQPGAVPFFSTVTGERCAGESCNAAYWARGIREPVRFASAVGALADFGADVWLELNAHPALAHPVQECLMARGAKATVISSARREREFESVLEAAMDLLRAGVRLDFSAMTPSRHLLSLPGYAWEKARWWNEASDARDGRLAPGGRGLFDVRLPRAMPTWIVRLDSRHMAFLKDHKVENHVIFPAAAFVEMALEAGVQLFEGQPFVVEDFEIRKPLILPDPPSGVQLEFSYSPNERTFSIQSRFEQSVTWSLHVVGSMRGERTESIFASSKWADPSGTQSVAVDGFYHHMSDLGLRYGEEFRPVRELSAGAGRSAGRVVLSDALSPRAGEYALHPVRRRGNG